MAMQMVYGKDMVTKSGDILIDIQLNKDGSLQSKHYTFDVGEVINSYNIDLFVNASSINQTYLHDKNPGDVINLYGTLDNVPLVVKETLNNLHLLFRMQRGIFNNQCNRFLALARNDTCSELP